jgi:hypothetical protein
VCGRDGIVSRGVEEMGVSVEGRGVEEMGVSVGVEGMSVSR